MQEGQVFCGDQRRDNITAVGCGAGVPSLRRGRRQTVIYYVMTRKPTAKPDTQEAQYQRFLEIAKKVEADETPGSFDRAFKKVVGSPPTKRETKKPE